MEADSSNSAERVHWQSFVSLSKLVKVVGFGMFGSYLERFSYSLQMFVCSIVVFDNEYSQL